MTNASKTYQHKDVFTNGFGSTVEVTRTLQHFGKWAVFTHKDSGQVVTRKLFAEKDDNAYADMFVRDDSSKGFIPLLSIASSISIKKSQSEAAKAVSKRNGKAADKAAEVATVDAVEVTKQATPKQAAPKAPKQAAPKPEAPKPPKAPKAPKPEAEAFDANKVMQTLIDHYTAKGDYAKAASLVSMLSGATPTTEAPKPEAPKPEADESRAKRISEVEKANADILATVPTENRKRVEAMLKRLHDAGFPLARLSTNKAHQLDALRIFSGEKRGREQAFKNCMFKQAKAYVDKREAAERNGQPKPKQPAHCFVWSPAHGGQLYARDIFFERTEA